MANVVYETRNDRLDSVKVSTTYRRHEHIPHIGQRKRMKINGTEETLILNQLNIERVAEWNEDKNRVVYFYKANEEWGDYYVAW